jgi:hypothetical protein
LEWNFVPPNSYIPSFLVRLITQSEIFAKVVGLQRKREITKLVGGIMMTLLAQRVLVGVNGFQQVETTRPIAARQMFPQQLQQRAFRL